MIKPETVLKQIEDQKRVDSGSRLDPKARRTRTSITLQLASPPPSGWSPREKEFLRFIQDAFCKTLCVPIGKEIASHFGASEQTVKNQLHLMCGKVGLEHSYQLAFMQIESS